MEQPHPNVAPHRPTHQHGGRSASFLLISSLSFRFHSGIHCFLLHRISSRRLHQPGGRGLHGDACETPGEDGRARQGSGVGESLHGMLLRLQPGHLSSNLRLTALPPPS